MIMKKQICFIILSALMFSCASEKEVTKFTLSKAELMDKIKGGWAGQLIGCTYGGPTEFKYLGRMIPDSTTIAWKPEAVAWYFDNFPGLYDDLYMDMTFVSAIEQYGVKAPVDSFAHAFANKGYDLWAANQVARYNILQGKKAPESGHWLHNPHADDIDFQIESDFIGLMHPGMPGSTSDLADKIGHIMNYGDGWYGGVFVSNMYSLAFVSDDIQQVVNQAIQAIPEQSDFYKCIQDIIGWHKQYPDDWKKTWAACQKKWSNEIGSPDGVFAPYNIDAKINSAYVVIGLLYGQGDFFQSIDIATRCGQDSDCNPSTVAGILGTLNGYEGIPEKWKAPLKSVADRNFAYTEFSLHSIYDLGYKHALQRIEEEGGMVDEHDVQIKLQPVTSVRYEKSFEDHYPIASTKLDERLGGTQSTELVEYSFEGTGVVIQGNVQGPDDYVAKLAVYLNGQLHDTVNLPAIAKARRYELYHLYQLPKKAYKLELKLINPIDSATIHATGMVTYSDDPAIWLSKNE